ncbi:MAG: FG-GAP repeat protein [Ignavibacteriales bacterium]|nr:FG-GAP repeat protein [Ignavibacteriales bacterium]
MLKKIKYKIFFIVVLLYIGQIYAQDTLILITTIHGEKAGDDFNLVKNIGDVNGDGYDDMLISARDGNYAKLYYGDAIIDTNADLRFHCDDNNSQFGYSIVGNGDFNGDGFADFCIGVPNYYSFYVGAAFIYLGTDVLDTIPDLIIEGEIGWDLFGNDMAFGDINGDNFDDFIMGAPMDSGYSKGIAYIFMGGQTIDNGADLLLAGDIEYGYFGNTVSFLGDVNGDGYNDFIVGMDNFYLQGNSKAVLFFGGDSIGYHNSIELKGDTNEYRKDVCELGDINGDGYSDFSIKSNIINKIYLGSNLKDSIKAGYLTAGFNSIVKGIYNLNNDSYDDFARLTNYTEIIFGADTYKEKGSVQINKRFYEIENLGSFNGTGNKLIACGVDNRVEIYRLEKKTGIDKTESTAIKEYKLSQNYPNPFNPTTVISYQLPVVSKVKIQILNLLGQEIATLLDEEKEEGSYEVKFDGSGLSSGIYFYRMEANNNIFLRKMILIK